MGNRVQQDQQECHRFKSSLGWMGILACGGGHLPYPHTTHSPHSMWHSPSTSLTCHSCVCFRLDGDMPEGVETVNNSLVFLKPLQRNDSGVYRCEVGNDIGLRSRDMRIRIQGEPELVRFLEQPFSVFLKVSWNTAFVNHRNTAACKLIYQT